MCAGIYHFLIHSNGFTIKIQLHMQHWINLFFQFKTILFVAYWPRDIYQITSNHTGRCHQQMSLGSEFSIFWWCYINQANFRIQASSPGSWSELLFLNYIPQSNYKFFSPTTPMSDQDRISPNYIYTILCQQVMRIKKIIIMGLLIDLIPNSPN